MIITKLGEYFAFTNTKCRSCGTEFAFEDREVEWESIGGNNPFWTVNCPVCNHYIVEGD